MVAEHYKLSPRQKQIVRYLLSGALTDRELAKRMRTAAGTVDTQLLRIFTKMHARSRAEVLYGFVREGKRIRPWPSRTHPPRQRPSPSPSSVSR